MSVSNNVFQINDRRNRKARRRSMSQLQMEKSLEEQLLECRYWVFSVANISDPGHAKVNLHHLLQDGILLCNVFSMLAPSFPIGSIHRLENLKGASAQWKKRENIDMFLKEAISIGVVPAAVFSVDELYHWQNPAKIASGVFAFYKLCKSIGLIKTNEQQWPNNVAGPFVAAPPAKISTLSGKPHLVLSELKKEIALGNKEKLDKLHESISCEIFEEVHREIMVALAGTVLRTLHDNRIHNQISCETMDVVVQSLVSSICAEELHRAFDDKVMEEAIHVSFTEMETSVIYDLGESELCDAKLVRAREDVIASTYGSLETEEMVGIARKELDAAVEEFIKNDVSHNIFHFVLDDIMANIPSEALEAARAEKTLKDKLHAEVAEELYTDIETHDITEIARQELENVLRVLKQSNVSEKMLGSTVEGCSGKVAKEVFETVSQQRIEVNTRDEARDSDTNDAFEIVKKNAFMLYERKLFLRSLRNSAMDHDVESKKWFLAREKLARAETLLEAAKNGGDDELSAEQITKLTVAKRMPERYMEALQKAVGDMKWPNPSRNSNVVTGVGIIVSTAKCSICQKNVPIQNIEEHSNTCHIDDVVCIVGNSLLMGRRTGKLHDPTTS